VYAADMLVSGALHHSSARVGLLRQAAWCNVHIVARCRLHQCACGA
jgi:hypothetical protein